MPFPMSWWPHLHTFAYIARRHTSSTAMALRWCWEIWASQGGIAGFNYSLFRASPMSDIQMRLHEHVLKPPGDGSQRRVVALRRQACRCTMYLGPGAPRGLQRCFGDVPIAGRLSWDGWTIVQRWHWDIRSIVRQLQCYPPAIVRCPRPFPCYRRVAPPPVERPDVRI